MDPPIRGCHRGRRSVSIFSVADCSCGRFPALTAFGDFFSLPLSLPFDRSPTRCTPYFFFGPLLTIGGFGVDFVVLFPPLLDMLILPLVAAASTLATAAGSLFLETRGAVDGFVAAGLKRDLRFLTAARAGSAEHLARSAPSAVGRPVPAAARSAGIAL